MAGKKFTFGVVGTAKAIPFFEDAKEIARLLLAQSRSGKLAAMRIEPIAKKE